MRNHKCSKDIVRLLSKLGYTGELNYSAVAGWLFVMDIYIMPLPKPRYRWEVGVVYLGESLEHDEGLDMTVLVGSFMSLLDAIKAGVEYVVKRLDEVRQESETKVN